MEIIPSHIQGPLIIEPKILFDSRGYFFESYNARQFGRQIAPVTFVQDNESCSTHGVVRGLHFQRPPFTQAKLVRCISGTVIDVALDIRKGSPTYGKYVAVELSGDNHRMFFVPYGFAHGFAVLSDRAVFQYKCDNFYNPESEGGISILDKTLGIDWKVNPDDIILSEKDTRHPMLADFESPFLFEGHPA